MEGCCNEEELGYYQKQRRKKALDKDKLHREAKLWDRRFPGKPTRDAWKIMAGRRRNKDRMEEEERERDIESGHVA